MAADVTEYVLETLRAASAVTNLVVNGANGIFESGELDMDQLAENETTRRNAATPEKLLAIVVQDAGETADDEMYHQQRVGIWLYDRQRAYTNIRAVRNQVYLALQRKSSALEDPCVGRTAMLGLLFKSRTGHMHERRMAVDFETISFISPVMVEPA